MTSSSFEQDPRLTESSHFITDLVLCRVSLKRDKTWPWLYLVPRRAGIREIYDLTTDDQAQVIREISTASAALTAVYTPEKINVAALGNMVPQLHVHVFARFKSDPAWPKPVWAVQQDEIPYTDEEKKAEIQKLKDCLARLS